MTPTNSTPIGTQSTKPPQPAKRIAIFSVLR
ncbi:hypothetical protein SAMN06265795_103315 [Noviherbaspirillum humi]|uniref:Uncharacterized protein n=1 Tax=Noviherbaspirillum humi TaxID=1688639 RepID=A0A239FEA5_9BURK|nr:hypothetical protein SAMN06265795_103315 [Noviherbaspirillum humi]